MIIDFHGHACGPYLTSDAIHQVMNNNNILYLILLPGENNSKKEYSMQIKTTGEPLLFFNKMIKIVTKVTFAANGIDYGNNYVYNLSKKSPGKIIQFYWITKANLNKYKNDFDNMLYKGIKIHQCWDDIKIESLDFKKITEFAIENNLPVMIHPENKRQVLQLKNLIKSGNKCRFIIAHLFGFELFREDWSEYQKQIMFDISNAFWITDTRFINALQIIGDKNLLFGSDTPYGKHAIKKTIEMVEKNVNNKEQIDNICFENAVNYLKLDV